MQKQIKVTIERNDPDVCLVFGFEKQLKLNISSDQQDEVKAFFQNLLQVVFDNYVDSDIEFSLVFSDEESDLFHDVARKYISNLENEIQSIYSNLKV